MTTSSSPKHPRRRRKAQPVRLSDLVLKVYPSSEPDDARTVRSVHVVGKGSAPARCRKRSSGAPGASNAVGPCRDQRMGQRSSTFSKRISFRVFTASRQRARSASSRYVWESFPHARRYPGHRPRRPAIPVTSLPDEVARALASVPDDSLREADRGGRVDVSRPERDRESGPSKPGG